MHMDTLSLPSLSTVDGWPWVRAITQFKSDPYDFVDRLVHGGLRPREVPTGMSSTPRENLTDVIAARNSTSWFSSCQSRSFVHFSRLQWGRVR